MERTSFPLKEGQAAENIERTAARRVINLQVGMMVAVVLWLFFCRWCFSPGWTPFGRDPRSCLDANAGGRGYLGSGQQYLAAC